MALLGELAVNLLARTQKFDQGMQRSRKQLGRFEKAAQSTQKSMKLLRGGLAAVGGFFAAGVIARNVRQVADELDTLGKTADRLGLTTEALGGLRHAAEQTGVDIRQFDTALQRMVRRVQEASQGTGEAQDALVRLGLSAENLAGLKTDQQFRQIADSMKDVESQSERVALAFKLFDSEGVKLLNTLELGSKGLQAMQEDAERLGITISDDQAKQMAKFNDELDRLSKLTAGLKQGFVIDVAPAVVETVEGLRLFMQDLKSIQVGAGNAFDAVRNTGRGAVSFIQRFSGAGAAGGILARGVEAIQRRGGGTFSAPAASANELIGQRPENFVTARAPRSASELREIRIKELRELVRMQQKDSQRDQQQHRELISTLKNDSQPLVSIP